MTIENEINKLVSLNGRGLLLHKGILYIPNSMDVKLIIMDKLHKRPYSRHPGYLKMITMTRKDFFWPNMKREVVEYLARCIQ